MPSAGLAAVPAQLRAAPRLSAPSHLLLRRASLPPALPAAAAPVLRAQVSPALTTQAPVCRALARKTVLGSPVNVDWSSQQLAAQDAFAISPFDALQRETSLLLEIVLSVAESKPQT